MKKILIGMTAALVLVTAGGAYADDSSDLIVTARVADTCTTITDGTPALISLDPMVGGAIDNDGVTTQPTINCTMGSSHAVSCSSANANKLMNGLNEIAYTYDAASVCGTNITGNGSTPVPLTLGIDIADIYQDKPAGDYSDTITITVAY